MHAKYHQALRYLRVKSRLQIVRGQQSGKPNFFPISSATNLVKLSAWEVFLSVTVNEHPILVHKWANVAKCCIPD